MNRPSGRNSAGRGAARGSDNNRSNSGGAPRGAKRASSSDKPFKKPFDDSKKPYGRNESSGDRPARPSKPYGDRPSGPSRGDGPARPYNDRPTRGDGPSKPYGDKRPSRSSDDRPARPYNDRPSRGDGPSKPYGDKRPARSSDDRPARPYNDRPSRGDGPSKPYGDRNSDKPARGADRIISRGGERPTYKDYQDKGKAIKRAGDSDERGPDRTSKPYAKRDTGFESKRPERNESERPKRAFKEKGEKSDSPVKSTRPRLDKKPTSKYQMRKDALENEGKASKSNVQSGIRLNKFIANSGMCSRREADIMIQNGVVMVNGAVLDELGYKVQSDDVVKFDGRTIVPEKPVYLILNKPKDYITTAEDPEGRKTVMALIEGACKERVFPVGRLDRNTTGLLLFTNDGEMADKLMHPRKRVKKIYMVELDKNLKADDLRQLREGITLEDGAIKPDVVEYAEGPKPDKKIIGVEIHSGRNRIVRRMFEHFGYKVVKLDRVYLAGLTKKNLPRGHYRMLDPMEINMLKML